MSKVSCVFTIQETFVLSSICKKCQGSEWPPPPYMKLWTWLTPFIAILDRFSSTALLQSNILHKKCLLLTILNNYLKIAINFFSRKIINIFIDSFLCNFVRPQIFNNFFWKMSKIDHVYYFVSRMQVVPLI